MFLSDVATAAKQVFILYVLVLLGFICDRTKIYTEKAARLTNDLLFYIVTPAVIIQSFSSVEMTDENVRGMLMSFLGGTILHVVAIAICIPFWRKTDKNPSCIYKYAAIYGNVGYMALPLAEAELGAEGVFFCSGVLIPFNIFAFTHGIYLMSGESAKKTGFNPKWLILNPGVVSVLLGLPLFFFNIRLPSLISVPVNYVAGLNTPLAMIMFGTYLSKTNLKTMFLKKDTYLVAFLKLIALPAVILAVLKLMGVKGTLLTALIISASAPSANNTVMFAAKYGKDSAAASQVVAVASLLSIITMPLFIALSQI